MLKNEFPGLPPIFRFLITSRQEHDINLMFSESESITTLDLSNNKNPDSTLDIRTFIQFQMSDVQHHHELPDDWIKNEDTEKLVENLMGCSSGSTVSELLKLDHDPISQLHILVSTNEAQGLDSMYRLALETSCKWQREKAWEDFKRLMAAVLFSREHVTDHIIDQFLGLTDRNSS